jgi:GMP synthase-like glutamine amidotransferase
VCIGVVGGYPPPRARAVCGVSVTVSEPRPPTFSFSLLKYMVQVLVIDNRTPLSSLHTVVCEKHTMTSRLIATLSSMSGVDVQVIATVEDMAQVDVASIGVMFISGSAMRVTRSQDLPTSRTAIVAISQSLLHGIPIVGICYGAQLLTWMLGGTVAVGPKACHTPYTHATTYGDMYFNHKDVIVEAPPDFEILSRHARWGYATTMLNKAQNIFLVQWHPEGSEDGQQFLRQFMDTIEDQRMSRARG